MTSGELDVTEGHSGIEGGHDEGCPEHVRVDVTESSAPSDGAHPAMGGAPIQAFPRGTAEDRSFGPFARGQIDWVRLRWSDEPSCSSRRRALGVAHLVDPVALPVEVELPVALEVAIGS